MRDIVRQTNRVVLNTSERIASRWFCDAAPQADVQYAAQIRRGAWSNPMGMTPCSEYSISSRLVFRVR